MQTVVVTGAAGSLGQRVVRLLAGRDDVKRVVAIDVVPLGDEVAGVESRVLDLAWAPPGPDDELRALLEGADGVIHLAWRIPDRRSADAARAAETNQRAIRRVLAAAEAVGPAAVIHLSSATVYGAWADNQVPLSEQAPIRPNPGFGFAVGKAEAERVVAEWAEDHGAIRVSVLRPCVTVGSPERPLYQALGGTHGPRTGDDGSRPVQFLHVDDLAGAVVHAWLQRLEGVYNVAPDNGVREDTARSLAGGVANVPLPERAAQTVAAWGWDLWRVGIPREALPYTLHPWVVAADKLRASGWEPHYSSEEALVATDLRPHWDDLPLGRRQNLTFLLAGGGVAAVAGLGALGVAAWRRRAQ